LGGFIGIGYAARHPGEVDGLCLLAPYLGSRIITREIEAARGLASWPEGKLADDDEERRTWRFIKDHRAVQLSLHLGFGREDRFADSHRLMAAALPAEDVDVVTGGHDWPTWLQLWQNFLDARFSSADSRTHERHCP
jgi:pimeloyl-ACP methyl ester carboxylesterase